MIGFPPKMAGFTTILARRSASVTCIAYAAIQPPTRTANLSARPDVEHDPCDEDH
jgi:hypothetical protein